MQLDPRAPIKMQLETQKQEDAVADARTPIKMGHDGVEQPILSQRHERAPIKMQLEHRAPIKMQLDHRAPIKMQLEPLEPEDLVADARAPIKMEA